MRYNPTEFKVVRVRELPDAGSIIADHPDAAVQYWRDNIATADWYDPCKEAFVVIALNTRRRIIGHNLVSLGTLDSSLWHPREVFRPLIVMAASACIIMHNHPSGDPAPSESDIKATRDLKKAGELLKIELLDHVIVGDGFKSLRELNYLY